MKPALASQAPGRQATGDGSLALPRRLRRLRRSPCLRDLSAETTLSLRQLVQGHFVLPGRGRAEAIATLPGLRRYSVDRLLPAIEADLKAGVRAVMLFGLAEEKDAQASGAGAADSAACEAARALKKAFGHDLVVMADVCLCAYTDHGHCGLVEAGKVLNDSSVAVLATMALALAQAGADFVCPSDMMDGRIGEIRRALDAGGCTDTAILAYTAKYASAFYGPFRDAAGSAPGFGDRRSYQMDLRNRREALAELALDLEEGADVVMVKPALAYLDVIADFQQAADVPVAAYNVSGEYAMVLLAAQAGLAGERALALEVLQSIRRAGADLIVTYHASKAAAEGWLAQ